jgi:catechol 2,3-dioxygenase-like lactoylglutathione lyase family enzyme
MGGVMTRSERAVIVHQIWPLLVVRDIDRSVEFYRDRLGFSVVGQAESEGRMYWCRLERGGASIMLQEADDEDGPAEGRGRGITFYFICEDADAVHADLSARGLQLEPPALAYYGMKQVFLPEPDGYSLCFESPTADWRG